MNRTYTQVINMKNIRQICFHGSSLTKFLQEDHTVIIEIEDVLFDTSICNFRIKCLNVEEIKTDEDTICEAAMALPDGEILTLRINEKENELFMLVQWYDFKDKTLFTKSYQIKCQEIQAEELSRREARENGTFRGFIEEGLG